MAAVRTPLPHPPAATPIDGRHSKSRSAPPFRTAAPRQNTQPSAPVQVMTPPPQTRHRMPRAATPPLQFRSQPPAEHCRYPMLLATAAGTTTKQYVASPHGPKPTQGEGGGVAVTAAPAGSTRSRDAMLLCPFPPATGATHLPPPPAPARKPPPTSHHPHHLSPTSPHSAPTFHHDRASRHPPPPATMPSASTAPTGRQHPQRDATTRSHHPKEEAANQEQQQQPHPPFFLGANPVRRRTTGHASPTSADAAPRPGNDNADLANETWATTWAG